MPASSPLFNDCLESMYTQLCSSLRNDWLENIENIYAATSLISQLSTLNGCPSCQAMRRMQIRHHLVQRKRALAATKFRQDLLIAHYTIVARLTVRVVRVMRECESMAVNAS